MGGTVATNFILPSVAAEPQFGSGETSGAHLHPRSLRSLPQLLCGLHVAKVGHDRSLTSASEFAEASSRSPVRVPGSGTSANHEIMRSDVGGSLKELRSSTGRVMKSPFIAISLLLFATCANSQGIPNLIWGKWIIRREIPTAGVSCWGKTRAEALLGTDLYYSSRIFRWNTVVIRNPTATERVIDQQTFAHQYSGGDAQYSVDLRDLGIMAKKVVVISIHHPPANITCVFRTKVTGDSGRT